MDRQRGERDLDDIFGDVLPSTTSDERDLDDIFGDVLPSTTSDERDPAPPEDNTDEWYERERPPHHD